MATVLSKIAAIGTKRNSRMAERRSSPRIPYHVQQRYAPILKGKPLTGESFRPMQCRDISIDGLSFYWRWVPESFDVLVELSVEGETSYLRARVRRCKFNRARQEYLVRCQFTERMLKLPER